MKIRRSKRNQDIECAYDFDTLKKKILDKLSKEGYNTEDTATIDYADGAADLLERSPNPDVNEWYEDTKRNYPENLKHLLRKVTSASRIDDADYLDELCSRIESYLKYNDYVIESYVEGEYLIIDSPYNREIKYLQPIEDIDPIWEDLDKDAEELADSFIQEYPDPGYVFKGRL